MDFNSVHPRGMTAQNVKQKLQMTGQPQSRQKLIPKNIQGNMTSSRPGASSPQNFHQGGNVMPPNIQGSMTSSRPPNSMNFSLQNFQQEDMVNPQNSMTSSGLVNPSPQNFHQGGRVMLQNVPGSMTSSAPPNSVNFSPQNFQQGGRVNIQGNMTSYRPPMNLSQRNSQQGGRLMSQNIQGNMTSSGPNSSQQIFQQGGMVQQNLIRPSPLSVQQVSQSGQPPRMANLQPNSEPASSPGPVPSSEPYSINGGFAKTAMNITQGGMVQQNLNQQVSQSGPHYEQPRMMANLQPQNVMQRNQIVRPSPQPGFQRNNRPRVEQVSQPDLQFQQQMQHNVSGLNQQKPENTGSESLDLREKIYEKIMCMREKYLQELNEILVKFSDIMQKQQPENQQRLEQRQHFKKNLEFLVGILRMKKSDVRVGYLDRLDSVEKQIISILEKKRRSSSVVPIALAPKPQHPQPAQIVNLDDDDDEVDEAHDHINASASKPQLPQTQIIDVGQPMNLEIEAHRAQDISPSTNFTVSSPQPQLPQTRIIDVGQPMNLKIEVHRAQDISPSTNSAVSSPQPQLPQTRTINVGQPMNLEIEVHRAQDISPSTNSAVSSPQPPLPQSPIFIDVDDDHQLMNLENGVDGAHDINASTSAISSPQTQLAQSPVANDYQTVNLEVAHNVDTSTEDSSSKLTPFERLRKAVESMPRASLRAAVGDIGEAVRMVDSVAGYPPENGCRAAFGLDFVATTLSGTKRMRRFM